MSLEKLLFWEKYRPKSIKGMVLLPRIEKAIEGVDSNMIFYGTAGTGKTTLARIIASEFNALILNGKLGIDILSDKITEHIHSFNLLSSDQTKLIFLDEFDRASITLQDGMKSFIEEYPNVRFVFTTNHIDKITPELKSRFNCISFDPIDSEERSFLQKRQILYLRSIAKKENFDGFNNVELFERLVNKNFPDLRSCVVSLQQIIKIGEESSYTSEYGTDKIDLYRYIMLGDLNPISNYDYVMNNYFINFDDAFKFLSRPFFEYLKDLHNELLTTNGALILMKQKEYNLGLETTIDPIIHLINYILDLKIALQTKR